MKKAILIVDIPDDVSIEKCVIDYEVTEKYYGEQLIADGTTMLRPMPEKYTDKNVKQIHGYIEDFEMYCLGRNDLIDEILGENNESNI